MKRQTFRLLIFLLMLAGLGAFPIIAGASHSWGNYHWARTSNPFTLKLGDNLTSSWDPYLATTSSDWSVSTVLDTAIVAGQGWPNCRANKGRVEVCNKTYGSNGWLGVATVWTNGSHIVQGTVKVNDTYFKMTKYNKLEWKQAVMCQEVGHTLGLDHQDEDFNNTPLGTCMDYSSDPTLNQHPNAHDYEQLETTYEHLDGTTTVSSMPAGMASGAFESPSQWGKLVSTSRDGSVSLYARDFGGGHKVFNFVIWAR